MSTTPSGFPDPHAELTGEFTRPYNEIPGSPPTQPPVSTPGTQLMISRGPGAGTCYPVTEPCTTLGRHRTCDIMLDDVTVSRRHAELHHDGDRYVIKDTGSLNGIYVNRKPVDQGEVSDGDEVWIGKFHLVFRLGA
jgi:pSer/pThr/pTyr-binding forkhead associated (FHA) protein